MKYGWSGTGFALGQIAITSTSRAPTFEASRLFLVAFDVSDSMSHGTVNNMTQKNLAQRCT